MPFPSRPRAGSWFPSWFFFLPCRGRQYILFCRKKAEKYTNMMQPPSVVESRKRNFMVLIFQSTKVSAWLSQQKLFCFTLYCTNNVEKIQKSRLPIVATHSSILCIDYVVYFLAQFRGPRFTTLFIALVFSFTVSIGCLLECFLNVSSKNKTLFFWLRKIQPQNVENISRKAWNSVQYFL